MKILLILWFPLGLMILKGNQWKEDGYLYTLGNYTKTGTNTGHENMLKPKLKRDCGRARNAQGSPKAGARAIFVPKNLAQPPNVWPHAELERIDILRCFGACCLHGVIFCILCRTIFWYVLWINPASDWWSQSFWTHSNSFIPVLLSWVWVGLLCLSCLGHVGPLMPTVDIGCRQNWCRQHLCVLQSWPHCAGCRGDLATHVSMYSLEL